jgi:hypothetical protein
MPLASFPITKSQAPLPIIHFPSPKMCESHTVYHLCGHVKIKTIVQCAKIIDQLISSGQPITCNHQVCDCSVSENVHIFPDICDKCKQTGVIGDFMEIPGVKVDALRGWMAKRNMALEESSSEDETSRAAEDLETLEYIPLPNAPTTSPASTTIRPDSTEAKEDSKSSTPDLRQIKTRVAALRARTEGLLIMIRAHKPPTPGLNA